MTDPPTLHHLSAAQLLSTGNARRAPNWAETALMDAFLPSGHLNDEYHPELDAYYVALRYAQHLHVTNPPPYQGRASKKVLPLTTPVWLHFSTPISLGEHHDVDRALLFNVKQRPAALLHSKHRHRRFLISAGTLAHDSVLRILHQAQQQGQHLFRHESLSTLSKRLMAYHQVAQQLQLVTYNAIPDWAQQRWPVARPSQIEVGIFSPIIARHLIEVDGLHWTKVQAWTNILTVLGIWQLGRHVYRLDLTRAEQLHRLTSPAIHAPVPVVTLPNYAIYLTLPLGTFSQVNGVFVMLDQQDDQLSYLMVLDSGAPDWPHLQAFRVPLAGPWPVVPWQRQVAAMALRTLLDFAQPHSIWSEKPQRWSAEVQQLGGTGVQVFEVKACAEAPVLMDEVMGGAFP